MLWLSTLRGRRGCSPQAHGWAIARRVLRRHDKGAER